MKISLSSHKFNLQDFILIKKNNYNLFIGTSDSKLCMSLEIYKGD